MICCLKIQCSALRVPTTAPSGVLRAGLCVLELPPVRSPSGSHSGGQTHRQGLNRESVTLFRGFEGDTCSLVFSLISVEVANPLRWCLCNRVEASTATDEWVSCHATCHIKELFQGRLSSVRGTLGGGGKNAPLVANNPVSRLPLSNGNVHSPRCRLAMLPWSDSERHLTSSFVAGHLVH